MNKQKVISTITTTTMPFSVALAAKVMTLMGWTSQQYYEDLILLRRLELPQIEDDQTARDLIETELSNIMSSSLDKADQFSEIASIFLHVPRNIFKYNDLDGFGKRLFSVSVFSDKIWDTGLLPHYQVMVVSPSQSSPLLSPLFVVKDAWKEPVQLTLTPSPLYTPTAATTPLEKRKIGWNFEERIAVSGIGISTENPLVKELDQEIFEKQTEINRAFIKGIASGRSRAPSTINNATVECPSIWLEKHERIWKTRIILHLYKWALLKVSEFQTELSQLRLSNIERIGRFSDSELRALFVECVQLYASQVVNPVISRIISSLSSSSTLFIFQDSLQDIRHFPVFDEEYLFFALSFFSDTPPTLLKSDSRRIAFEFLQSFSSNWIDPAIVYRNATNDISISPPFLRQWIECKKYSSINLQSLSYYNRFLQGMFDDLSTRQLNDLEQIEECQISFMKTVVFNEVREIIVTLMELDKLDEFKKSENLTASALRTFARAIVFRPFLLGVGRSDQLFLGTTSASYFSPTFPTSLIVLNVREIYREVMLYVVGILASTGFDDKLRKVYNEAELNAIQSIVLSYYASLATTSTVASGTTISRKQRISTVNNNNNSSEPSLPPFINYKVVSDISKYERDFSNNYGRLVGRTLEEFRNVSNYKDANANSRYHHHHYYNQHNNIGRPLFREHVLIASSDEHDFLSFLEHKRQCLPRRITIDQSIYLSGDLSSQPIIGHPIKLTVSNLFWILRKLDLSKNLQTARVQVTWKRLLYDFKHIGPQQQYIESEIQSIDTTSNLSLTFDTIVKSFGTIKAYISVFIVTKSIDPSVKETKILIAQEETNALSIIPQIQL